MPKVSGLEFLVKLPLNTFKGKIIVLSAYLTPELEVALRSLGAEGIMPKHFDVNELRKAVEELRPLERARNKNDGESLKAEIKFRLH